MSRLELRNLENKSLKKNSPKAAQNLRLSFSKLAADREKQALQGKPALQAQHTDNNYNNNRKRLYEESGIYLNQVL